MKKHISIVLLFPLLMFAFADTVILSVQKAVLSSSIASTSNDGFKQNVNYPAEEIEQCNISGHFSCRAPQLFKKLPGFSASRTNCPKTSFLLSSSTVFPGLTALENKYLSHNYPSHNFW